eukprot:scaffold33777_cov50-Phaeocystis_antarctica.AAC.1
MTSTLQPSNKTSNTKAHVFEKSARRWEVSTVNPQSFEGTVPHHRRWRLGTLRSRRATGGRGGEGRARP